MADYDSPWKEVLDRFFALVLSFLLPKAHADIDWTRDHESLETDRCRRSRRAISSARRPWWQGWRTIPATMHELLCYPLYPPQETPRRCRARTYKEILMIL
jgi:hypothetical protein